MLVFLMIVSVLTVDFEREFQMNSRKVGNSLHVLRNLPRTAEFDELEFMMITIQFEYFYNMMQNRRKIQQTDMELLRDFWSEVEELLNLVVNDLGLTETQVDLIRKTVRSKFDFYRPKRHFLTIPEESEEMDFPFLQ